MTNAYYLATKSLSSYTAVWLPSVLSQQLILDEEELFAAGHLCVLQLKLRSRRNFCKYFSLIVPFTKGD